MDKDKRIGELLAANNVLVERVRAARVGLKRAKEYFQENNINGLNEAMEIYIYESDPK